MSRLRDHISWKHSRPSLPRTTIMGFSTKFAVWYPRGEGLLAPLSSPTPTSSYQVTRQCRESRHRSAPASKILFWYSAVVCASCGGGMSAVANVGRDQHRVGMYVEYVQHVRVRCALAAADSRNPTADECRGVRGVGRLASRDATIASSQYRNTLCHHSL